MVANLLRSLSAASSNSMCTLELGAPSSLDNNVVRNCGVEEGSVSNSPAGSDPSCEITQKCVIFI